MKSKKGQGLSVSMIILIVLGLIILGVLVFMIAGKVRQFGTSTNDCVEKRGECVPPAECGGSIIGQMDCEEGEICCVSYAEEEKTG